MFRRILHLSKKSEKVYDRDDSAAASTTGEWSDVDADADAVEEGMLGLDVLVEGIDPVVDIIAIHGLNGHREKTWTASNKVNWLRDLTMLPAVIPNARIMTWGYDANTHGTKEISGMYLYDHGRNLVSDISLARRVDKTDRRPIIFIAHSLGGIVLKSALIHSDSTRSRHLYHHKSIKISTYGIMFMGTPHQGGEGVAWGKRLVNIASIFVKTNDKLLKVLERDSEALQEQLGQYAAISSDFETKFAFETKATPLALGQSLLVVPKSSAVVPGQVDAEPIAIMADHNKMVKFTSAKSSEFNRVANHLKLMAESAPAKIVESWRTESSVETVRGGDHSPAPSTQSFSVAFDLTGTPRTSAFIGRKSDLVLIAEQLTPGKHSDGRKICVLIGLGGIGKTQLAIEYARQQKYSYSSFFWLDGKTEESLIRSILNIPSRLPKGPAMPTESNEGADLDESRKMAQEILGWFALEGNTQWLLIYDNIDETSYEAGDDATNSSTYDITHYFPRGDSGSIIITTRLQRLQSLGGEIHVRKAERLDSLLILEQHARRSLQRSDIQPGEVDKSDMRCWDPDAIILVDRLGHLPLALVFAGSYIYKTTIAKYFELYDRSWKDLHGTMKNRQDYPGRTIVTTWQISFDQLKLKDEGAANLLRLWGYLDNHDLWYELLLWRGHRSAAPPWLLKVTSTEVTFLETIETLLDYSLIERNENNKSYSMHAVVHDWIRTSINEKNNDGLLELAIATVGLAVPGNNTRDSWEVQRRLLQHIMQFSQYLTPKTKLRGEVDTESLLASFNNIGRLYVRQGQLSLAENMYLRALSGREAAHGRDHALTLNVINNLGNCYRHQLKFDEAEAMFKRALGGYRKDYSRGYLSALKSTNNLANLYWHQKRLTEAEDLYLQALDGLEKELGADHTITLSTVNNLGTLYRNQHRYEDSEAMYKRALEGREQALGPNHRSTLNTANSLAVLYCTLGRDEEAEVLYKRSLAGREQSLGAGHNSTVRTARGLVELYEKHGRYPEAESLTLRMKRSSVRHDSHS